MMSEKYFLIYEEETGQQFVRAHRMGKILLRSEVSEIAAGFKSEAKRGSDDTLINIVPPVPKDRLPELGDVLIQLAVSLDPSEPAPTYSIAPKLNWGPKT